MNFPAGQLEIGESSPSVAILQKELSRIGYPERYVRACWGGLVPCGMAGTELLELFERIQPRYAALGLVQR